MTDRNENNSAEPSQGDFSKGKQDLADIDRRLSQLRDDDGQPSKLATRIKAPPSNVLGLAFRVSVELVSALAVGAAIGWSLDYFLETRPWFMLVFVVLGGVAGMLNVYRLASGFGYAAGYKSSEANVQDSDNVDPEQR